MFIKFMCITRNIPEAIVCKVTHEITKDAYGILSCQIIVFSEVMHSCRVCHITEGHSNSLALE